MITCMTVAQAEYWVSLLGDIVERVSLGFIVHATNGDVLWKYHASHEMFCRLTSGGSA